MLTKTILFACLIIYWIRGLPYLIAYYRLRRYGLKAFGNIENVEQNSWFINWFWPSAPLVKFLTVDAKEVLNKPICSFSTGNNDYKAGRLYTLYYLPKNPEKFVIKSQIEIRANILWVILTLGFILGIFFS